MTIDQPETDASHRCARDPKQTVAEPRDPARRIHPSAFEHALPGRKILAQGAAPATCERLKAPNEQEITIQVTFLNVQVGIMPNVLTKTPHCYEPVGGQARLWLEEHQLR